MMASACTAQAPWLEIRLNSFKPGPEVGVIQVSVFAATATGESGEGVVTLLHEGTVHEAVLIQGQARFRVDCALSGASCADRVTLVARWQGLEARLDRRVAEGVSDGTSEAPAAPARPRDDSAARDAGSCRQPVVQSLSTCGWGCGCDFSCQTSDGGPVAVIFPTFGGPDQGPSCSEGEICASTFGVPAQHPGLPAWCCQLRRGTGARRAFGECTVSGLRPGMYGLTLWTQSASCQEPVGTSLHGFGVPPELPEASFRVILICHD
jgi:hypothetical protein